MDPKDLEYLENEFRADIDIKKQEEFVVPTPDSPKPVRKAPYLRVAVDNRPHVSTVEKPWPGAYIEALRYVAKDANEEGRDEARTALKMAIMEGSYARGHKLVPGKVDEIASALIACARVDGMRRDVL